MSQTTYATMFVWAVSASVCSFLIKKDETDNCYSCVALRAATKNFAMYNTMTFQWRAIVLQLAFELLVLSVHAVYPRPNIPLKGKVYVE